MNLSRCFLATTAATAFVGVLSLPSQAATLFGTNGIQFDQNVTLKFTFDGSNNFYQSTLSIVGFNPLNPTQTSTSVIFQETKGSDNGTANGFAGTCGNTVNGPFANCVNYIPLVGGWTYTLRLDNINPNDGTPGLSPNVFSTSLANGGFPGTQRAVFGSFGGSEGVQFAGAGSFTSGDPFASPVRIAFEDGGFAVNQPNDGDFNDFRLTAQVAIPIPPPLAGLLLFGTLSFFRRRQANREAIRS